MSARLKFSVSFVCDVCRKAAMGVEYETEMAHGTVTPQIPNPTPPEGWVFVRGDFSEAHYCGRVCAFDAAVRRWGSDQATSAS